MQRATLLCLTACSLLLWATCKPRVVTQPVLIDEVRIVGKVTSGAVVWQPGESQSGPYYIVTPALVTRLFSLALDNQELRAEIKKLQAKDE